MAKKQAKQTKKRKVRVEAMGEAHIGSSFNNIIISLTNQQIRFVA
jgi:small subunit ribosomal protein S11